MLILSICSLAFLEELGALTKIDIQNKNIDRIQKEVNEISGKMPFKISSLSGEGLKKILQIIFDELEKAND